MNILRAAETLRAIPVRGRDGAVAATLRAGVLLGIVTTLAACNAAGYSAAPGTPEYAAQLVSRGYDCGLRPQRGRIAAAYRGEERRRFMAANAGHAVRSYNRPVACGEWERSQVARDLRVTGSL